MSRLRRETRNMSGRQPIVAHVYQNHTIDSTRWDHFRPRPDDIIVVTTHRSGTTWMQAIATHLIAQDLQPHFLNPSFWIDLRLIPLRRAMAEIEEAATRRVLKSHLPLDGLRFLPELRYIFVGRDPRDICMSMWSFYSTMTPQYLRFKNHFPGRVGPPIPSPPADVREFWKDWMTRGWFPWEHDGYPFWSVLHHTTTWWEFRHLPNILFIHYNDLLADLLGQIARIADFLAIEVAPEMVAAIVDKVSFTSMKRDAGAIAARSDAMFNRGTNGRWRDVLTADDVALYTAAARRELPPDLGRWLETGGPVS